MCIPGSRPFEPKVILDGDGVSLSDFFESFGVFARNRAAVTTSTKKGRSDKAKALLGRRSRLSSVGLVNGRVLPLCDLLIAATLAVYVQVRRFDFVLLDDWLYVVENEHVRDGVSLANLGWAFNTWRDGNWFPLTWISLMFDASAYGMWPGGYHITNLALHAANVLLVFATLSKMTRSVLTSTRSLRHCLQSIRCMSSRWRGSPSARTC